MTEVHSERKKKEKDKQHSVVHQIVYH